MRSKGDPGRHTRRLLEDIHPNALEYGFPIKNVGNDGNRPHGKNNEPENNNNEEVQGKVR